MESNEELKKVYDMFTDTWRFYKKNADIENTDKYWENVIAESEQISKKYNSKFANALILAVLDELERKSKELMSDEVKNE